jgi:hypothetical protein
VHSRVWAVVPYRIGGDGQEAALASAVGVFARSVLAGDCGESVMPTLAEILSGIDGVLLPAKRRLSDLLTNPRDYTAQAFGNVGDNIAQFNRNAVTAQEGQDLKRMGSVMGDAPQYQKALASVVNSMMGMNPIGATVHHGSPHKFNKFDSSKIGTGEGAQSYGHGLYLADSPEVAAQYAKNLSGGGKSIKVGDRVFKIGDDPIADYVLSFVGKANDQKTPSKALYEAWSSIDHNFPPDKRDSVRQILGGWMGSPVSIRRTTENLYKVDLPDEQIAKMLDWDKPLSAQPEAVRRAMGVLDADSKKLLIGQDPKGAKLYELLASTDAFAGHGPLGVAASNHLRSQGIPGIRYLDGGSRAGGAGTSNYVVFPGNEGLLNILERNGKPVK